MLNRFNKRASVQQNVTACELTRKNRLNCFGDMMLFYPGETIDTLKETEEFIKTAKPTLVWLHLLTPLPKTKVFEDAKKNGTLMGAWKEDSPQPWIKIDGFDSIESMESHAKRMRIRILLNPRRLLWVMQSFGATIIKNPSNSLAVINSILFGKSKY